MDILGDTRIDWIRYRWWFAAVSLTVVVAGVFDVLRQGGFRYGIDFSEGTLVTAKFVEEPEVEAIREAVTALGYGGAVIQSSDDNQVMIRVEKEESEASGAEAGPGTEAAASQLDETANRILEVLRAGVAGNELEAASTEIVGPVVGEQLRRQGRNATLLALFAMLVYIGFRFEPVYGVGATVAVIHDVIVTLALVSLFDYEISLNVIAAFMTLVGYSVNDTIVIFDRVRENRHIHRRLKLADIVNLAINQTLRRTVLTSGLTLVAVGALLMWGGPVLKPFAFVLVAGVVVGTYSSVAIASPIVLWWREVRGKAAPPAELQRPAEKPLRV